MSKNVAFFDLDHTIIKESTGNLIVKDLYNKKLITHHTLIKSFILSLFYRIGIMKPETIITLLIKKLRGMDEKKILEYSYLFFETAVKPLISSQAIETIHLHKKQKAFIVLLTASLDFICKPIQDYLQFDYVLCTNLEVINGKYTGRLQSKYCYGKEKLFRAIQFCKENNCQLSHAHYYADSIADIHVLKAVGYPHCVNPHPPLLKIARKEGWPIHYW